MNNCNNGWNCGSNMMDFGGMNNMNMNNNFPMNNGNMGMPYMPGSNGFVNNGGFNNWNPSPMATPAPIYNTMTSNPAPMGANPIMMPPFGATSYGNPGMNPNPMLTNPQTMMPIGANGMQQPMMDPTMNPMMNPVMNPMMPTGDTKKGKKKKKKHNKAKNNQVDSNFNHKKKKVRVKGIFSVLFALIYCAVFFIGYAPLDMISDYIMILGGQNGSDYVGELISGIQGGSLFGGLTEISIFIICLCTVFVVLNFLLNLFSMRSKRTFGFIKFLNIVILLLLIAFVVLQCLAITIDALTFGFFGIGMFILLGDVLAMFLSAVIGK